MLFRPDSERESSSNISLWILRAEVIVVAVVALLLVLLVIVVAVVALLLVDVFADEATEDSDSHKV